MRTCDFFLYHVIQNPKFYDMDNLNDFLMEFLMDDTFFESADEIINPLNIHVLNS